MTARDEAKLCLEGVPLVFVVGNKMISAEVPASVSLKLRRLCGLGESGVD